MTKISLIETMLINEPVMMSQAKLTTIMSVLAERSNIDMSNIPKQEIMNTEAPLQSKSGAVAVIPINGSISHRPMGFEAMSGLTSYQDIEAQLNTALDNPKVTEIVLDINSHGGQVAGAFDLADKIYESRSIKPITAFVNEAAYSSAFLLASSAGEIFAPRTAGVGSIGVITAHVDNSISNEKNGRKVTYITAGIHKSDGNPDEPLGEEAHAHIQERIDSSYQLFVNTVARNRGVTASVIEDTQARTYTAQDALSLNLIDNVTSINSAFDVVLARNTTSTESPKNNTRRISRRASAITLT